MERFQDKEFTFEKIRHVPRNQYYLIDIDPLLKYLYKYNFEHYCIRFEVRDMVIGGRSARRFDNILDLIVHLNEKSKDLGIPIMKSGIRCYHNDVPARDPYFICRIYLGAGGDTIKPRVGNLAVYRVNK